MEKKWPVVLACVVALAFLVPVVLVSMKEPLALFALPAAYVAIGWLLSLVLKGRPPEAP